jgi:lysozyme
MATIKQKVAASALALSLAAAGGIIAHEGWVKVGYKDPIGVVTACAGHTATAQLGKVYTEAECLALLQQDVKTAEDAVKRLVKVRITQDQFDALVSFTFNVGSGNLARSTLLAKLNAGDCRGAADEFLRWNKADGKVFRGLTIRRQDERKLFLKGCKDAPTSRIHFGYDSAPNLTPSPDADRGHPFGPQPRRREVVGDEVWV